MRRLAACMGALLLVSPPLLTGCDDYDDSELWQNVNDLKSRIEALETKIGQMNTEIAALQKIVDDAVTVVKVEKGAVVKNCVLMQGTTVESNAKLEYIVTDKDVTITANKTLLGNESFPVYVEKGTEV